MPNNKPSHINTAGWLESAAVQPSDNYNERPAGITPRLLVVHNISLPPGQFGGGYVTRFFQNQLPVSEHPFFEEIADLKVSSHFFIDRTGQLTQFVSVYDRAWHAGVSQFCGEANCNDFSIGVELEGTDDIPYTEEQYRELVVLSKSLAQLFPEMINQQHIVGHCDIAPGRKTDPGESFDWQRFRSAL